MVTLMLCINELIVDSPSHLHYIHLHIHMDKKSKQTSTKQDSQNQGGLNRPFFLKEKKNSNKSFLLTTKEMESEYMKSIGD